MRTIVITAFAATAILAGAAQAHTSIWPRQSQLGATEKYTIRIPTEGQVATVSVEVDVPEGVIVETMQVPNGWQYEVRRANDRIAGITYRMNIKPAEFIEIGLVARNPRQGTELVWGLRQRFADGKVEDFTRTAAGIRPTARVQLLPRPN